MIWMMNSEDTSIYSEKFRNEVNEAHRKFFEKRGIDPNNIPGISDYKSLWWTKKSVPPKRQHPLDPSPRSYNEKQKNA